MDNENDLISIYDEGSYFVNLINSKWHYLSKKERINYINKADYILLKNNKNIIYFKYE